MALEGALCAHAGFDGDLMPTPGTRNGEWPCRAPYFAARACNKYVVEVIALKYRSVLYVSGIKGGVHRMVGAVKSRSIAAGCRQ